MTETEILIEEYGVPEPKVEDYADPETYWAAHDAWLEGFSAWIQRKTAEEEAARLAEEEARREEEEAARQAEAEEEERQEREEVPLPEYEQGTEDRYPVGTYVGESSLDGVPYDPGSVGSYVDAAGNLWSKDGELLSPGTTPAMEPEEVTGEAAGEPVTGEPAIDTALLLMDLLDALTGENGMAGDIDGIQQAMDHPLMTTSFRDYTVTEGLLLLLLLSVFVAACAKMLKGGFSWLR